MFAIAWQYLSGRATAKEIDNHQEVEWPPHPDRVFQALVAAWGECGCDSSQKSALEWLEQQGAPQLAAPEVEEAAKQVTQVFVPVNDVVGPKSGEYKWGKHRGLLPEHRGRKERTFASVHVGDATCALIWPDAETPQDHRHSLAALCAAVTHVGHSRSLVRMWTTDDPPAVAWEPALETRHFQHGLKLRIPHAGRLERLATAYVALVDGRLARNAWPTSPWQDYVRSVTEESTPCGAFDSRLIVLRRVGGEGVPGLMQGPAYVRAIRATLMKAADGDASAMPLISGHEADGKPFQRPHIAFLPLAHVGHEHADGHLLGMGIALPCGLSAGDEQAIYDVVGKAFDPASNEITLKAGGLGTMLLAEEDRSENTRPFAMRLATWTGKATSWGTVTPIVLDRLPPRRHEGDDAWFAAQIVAACDWQGLPAPVEIRLLPVSPHIGAPACRAFPPLLRKPDGAKRWHVHAVLQFACPIEGPLLLGAGRYQGYGLCKPLQREQER
jgi:CRISPR-associated protein Csb2